MCYIDPPYNTGKDFIYKDNFTENVSDYYERTGSTPKEALARFTETFDISGKKSPYQLGIFLSDRVKSIIKGESPTFKKSGNFPKFEVK